MTKHQLYTDTPCGRFLEEQERSNDFYGGLPLTDDERAKLLFDQFYQIANFDEAREMLKTIRRQSQ